MRTLLEGKPLKHPLHPLLVHLPIAAFTLSLILTIAVQSDLSWQRHAASVAAIVGIVTGLLAAVAGLADWSAIRRDSPAKQVGLFHMILNVTVVILFIAAVVMDRASGRQPRPEILTIMIVAMGLLALSGYLGGEMVYNQGIAVGRHRRAAPGPRNTIRTAAPLGAGWYAVVDERQLANGGSLRVEIENKVLCLARVGGRLFAVQDFCTHRFGPLSEGQLDGTRVVCPWHRSMFDLATGEVVRRPAHEPLNHYPVEIRDGRICVKVGEPSSAKP